MTYGAFSTREVARYARRPRKETSYTLVCALALTIGGGVGATLLYANEPVAPLDVAVGSHVIPLIVMPMAAPAVQIARADPLFDPTPTTAATRTTFDQTAALGSGFAFLSAPAILPPPAPVETVASVEPAAAPLSNEEEPVAIASVAVTPDAPEVALPPVAVPAIPLPMPRPAFQTDAVPLPRSGGRRALAALTRPDAAPVSPSNPKSFFDTLFGAARPPETVLAYAAPEDRGLGRPVAIPSRAPEAGTAVYDISAHTVTLPNGTRLEAHSGLGPRLDDPRSVTEHMRGATPPNVYELTPRETPFHGVRALRLNPIAGTTYGRGGLLAHTFMLGPRGDSNGCVVFRDYAAFLRAYESGQIRRLMVVART